MSVEDVYILGIYMTKFGKHKELDTLDLATEATLAALKDGGVTMKDINVIAAGNLMGGAGSIAQSIQKACGQTGIPAYNVSNACATGATALRVAGMSVKAGESDFGLAVGVEKLAGAGLLGQGGGSGKKGKKVWEPKGRYGNVAGMDGRIGTDVMPGVFAQIGLEYDEKYGGADFELFAEISRKNHSHSTPNPLADIPRKCLLKRLWAT